MKFYANKSPKMRKKRISVFLEFVLHLQPFFLLDFVENLAPRRPILTSSSISISLRHLKRLRSSDQRTGAVCCPFPPFLATQYHKIAHISKSFKSFEKKLWGGKGGNSTRDRGGAHYMGILLDYPSPRHSSRPTNFPYIVWGQKSA